MAGLHFPGPSHFCNRKGRKGMLFGLRPPVASRMPLKHLWRDSAISTVGPMGDPANDEPEDIMYGVKNQYGAIMVETDSEDYVEWHNMKRRLHGVPGKGSTPPSFTRPIGASPHHVTSHFPSGNFWLMKEVFDNLNSSAFPSRKKKYVKLNFRVSTRKAIFNLKVPNIASTHFLGCGKDLGL